MSRLDLRGTHGYEGGVVITSSRLSAKLVRVGDDEERSSREGETSIGSLLEWRGLEAGEDVV